eukprot:gene5395-6069_t
MSSTGKGAEVMKDKYEGCLVGSLIGDCLGAPFEAVSHSCIDRTKVEDMIGFESEKLRQKKENYYEFTDDTAMMRSICRSLIENNGFHASDLASNFLEEFLREDYRGYGAGMFTIFEQWKSHGTAEDPFLAAREQFGGSGSYGNGAAMRVAPVALFVKSEEDVTELAKNTALLTHSNKHGYNGAILQALSVYKALNSSSNGGVGGKINKEEFLAELIRTMSKIENINVDSIFHCQPTTEASEHSGERKSRREDFSFTSQLILMRSMLKNSGSKLDQKSIVEAFGNDITAQEAVVAALYTFLSNCENTFAETILNAVTLGGDTDTIACMAGAIAGAYFGLSAIPPEWIRVCEGTDDAINFANVLFTRTCSS